MQLNVTSLLSLHPLLCSLPLLLEAPRSPSQPVPISFQHVRMKCGMQHSGQSQEQAAILVLQMPAQRHCESA